MRKLRNMWKQLRVQIISLLFIISFVSGFLGYWSYYKVLLKYKTGSADISVSEPKNSSAPDSDGKRENEIEVIISECVGEGPEEGTEPAGGILPVSDDENNGTKNAEQQKTDYRPLEAAFFRPLFSTLKLFGGVFDAALDADIVKAVKDNDANMKMALYCLFVARVSAFLMTTIAAVEIVKRTAPFFLSRIRFLLWDLRTEKQILVGLNNENIRLYRTAERTDRMLLVSETRDAAKNLWGQGIRWYAPENEYEGKEKSALEDLLFGQLRRTLEKQGRKTDVVINTENEELNLQLCRTAVEIVRQAVAADIAEVNEIKETLKDPEAQKTDPRLCSLRRQVIEKLERVRIRTFGDKQYEQLYLALENAAFGTLFYTNRYHLTSFDFVSEHPLTEQLTSGDILDGSGCIPADLDMNVIFVGFGDTNREIFLDLIATNQFITRKEGDIPQLSPVSYYIFDRKSDALHDKNLNHSILRYVDDFEPLFVPEREDALNREDYLELLPTPFRHTYLDVDINSEIFYNSIRKICTSNPKSVNRLIVAIGSDFDNLDLAQRLTEKKWEWNLQNLCLFIRVQNRKNAQMVTQLGGDESPYTLFGNNEFSLRDVMENETEEIAYRRKRVMYRSDRGRKEENSENSGASAARKSGKSDDEVIRVLYEWYNMDYIMRRSSIYTILGMKVKLQLLGLDFKKTPALSAEEKVRALSQEAYFAIYAKGCPPVEKRNSATYNGAMYSFNESVEEEAYYENLPRRNMAVQEHYRWNGFMIRFGFVPPTRADIEKGFNKDYWHLRRHANLCSYRALFEFRKIREKSGKKGDDIPYDYEPLDEAWFFLNECGYSILPREVKNQ